MDNAKKEVNDFIVSVLKRRFNGEVLDSHLCKSIMIMNDDLPIFVRVKRRGRRDVKRLAITTGVTRRSLKLIYLDTGKESTAMVSSCSDIFVWNFTTAEAVMLAKIGYIVHHQRQRVFILSKNPPHIIAVYNDSAARTCLPKTICTKFGTLSDGWTIRSAIGKDKSYENFIGGNSKNDG